MKYVPSSQEFKLTENVIEEIRESLSKNIINPTIKKEKPNPTQEDLESKEFNAIWDVIKSWDINVPEYDGHFYSGATGSHVKLILDALKNVK